LGDPSFLNIFVVIFITTDTVHLHDSKTKHGME